MAASTTGPTTVDEYIESFPRDVGAILEQVRQAMHRADPNLGERISYQIATLTLDGKALVYFAGWKHHVGIYPIPVFDSPLDDEVAPLRAAKDSIHLKFTKPIPYDLVERITSALIERRRCA